VDILNTLLIHLLDTFAPEKLIRVSKSNAPWLNNEIKQSMADRDSVFRLFKRCRDATVFQRYKYLRNKTKQLIRNAKVKFFNSAATSKISSSALWNKLHSIGIGSNKDSALPPNLSLDNLNNKFAEPPNHITKDIKEQTLQTYKSIAGRIKNHDKQFKFSPISQLQVYTSFKRVKSKAQGSDGIPLDFIKKLLPFILPFITNIFNSSLQQEHFPSQWKSSLIKPIPKKNDTSEAQDFRPISFLPILSKAFEKLIYDQVSNFLKHHNILDNFQSGFRHRHSTTTALVKITDDIRKSMDKKELTVLVLLDFSKAFDSIDKDILAAKLQGMGFSSSTTNWITSYLSDRKQKVVDNDLCSQWAEVSRGVPQGSILGPLLFSLYINDCPSVIKSCKYHLYADDLQIYLHSTVDSLLDKIKLINIDLAKLNIWSNANFLNINPSKSQAIVIGYPRILALIRKNELPPLSINGNQIPFCETVKNLGILIDENLSWSSQVNKICKSVRKSLFPLLKLKYVIPASLKKQLISTLIIPLIDYADVVYQDLSEELSLKLQRLFNACIRFIFNLQISDRITKYIDKLSWLKLSYRRQLHTLSLLHQILNTNTPHYLLENFKTQDQVHKTNTRGNKTLVIPQHRTVVYNKSFTVTACREWNKLNPDLRKASSISLFKRALHKTLLKSQQNVT
jgi:hypothetical protein